MRVYIEKVCIIFQIICYTGLGLIFFQKNMHSAYITSKDLEQIILIVAITIITPTGIRWLLTGKFLVLPVLSKD